MTNVPEAEQIEASVASYRPPFDVLLRLGEPDLDEWLDYRQVGGVGPDDVPELIRMGTDRPLLFAESPEEASYALLHAWRALAQLHAVAAVGPLIEAMGQWAEDDYDWYLEDYPRVFAEFGPVAVPPLCDYARNELNAMFPRVCAADCLSAIGTAHPEVRLQCIDGIKGALILGDTQDSEMNALLVGALLQLKAVEAYPLIRNSYAEGLVWEEIVGWGAVQKALGVDEPDPSPRARHPSRPAPRGPQPRKRRVKPATTNAKRRRRKKEQKKRKKGKKN